MGDWGDGMRGEGGGGRSISMADMMIAWCLLFNCSL